VVHFTSRKDGVATVSQNRVNENTVTGLPGSLNVGLHDLTAGFVSRNNGISREGKLACNAGIIRTAYSHLPDTHAYLAR
jgi:hypothetical protein